LVRRPRQAGNDTFLIENLVSAAERFRWFANCEGENAVVVENGRARRGDGVRLVNGSCFSSYGAYTLSSPTLFNVLSCHTSNPNRHIRYLDDRFPIGVHQRVGNRERLRTIAQLLDGDLIGHFSRAAGDLTTAFEPTGHSRQRLANDLVLLGHPAQAEKENSQGVQAALVHER